MMRQLVIIFVSAFFIFAGLASAEVWKDDFEREEIGEDWTPATRWPDEVWAIDWKIEDGILKGRWLRWSAQILFLKEYPSLDYTMQAKVMIDQVTNPSFCGAGFIFRSSGPPEGGKQNIAPYYFWGICTILTGFFVEHNIGNWQIVRTIPMNRETDRWYTLKLLVSGSKFLGYVDDEPVCKLSHDQYKGKFVGLILFSNTAASFDDFMITDRVDEEALADFDVSPEGTLTTTWAELKVQ